MHKKIFVSIASYRDRQCPKTVMSLLKNAKYPERVTIGICEQNKEGDVDCIDMTSPLIHKYYRNIKIKKIPYKEAKGPTWARYICSQLWNGEDYYLQIDSHTKAVKDWDEKLINMIEKINYPKCVISHYPPNVDDYEHEVKNKHLVTRICTSFFNNKDMISFRGAQFRDSKGECYEVPYIAAGFLFCSSDFLKEVPYDPNLKYLFTGEEILLSIRFWTHGWNIYTPSENIMFHYYTREKEPKIWTDVKYSDEEAINRVKSLIGLNDKPIIDEKYGLGQTRTLNNYYDFAGIDVKNKKILKNFGNENNKEETNISYYTSITIVFSITIVILVILYALFKKLI